MSAQASGRGGTTAGDDRSADAALADAAPLIVIGHVLQDREPEAATRRVQVERTLKGDRWDGIPAASTRYDESRDAIPRVERLLRELDRLSGW